MVEDREIVIKLSGDRGEYGTVTVPAAQLDAAWVEEEVRRVYEAGGLPAFMAADLARLTVEDIKTGEEKRRATELALATGRVARRAGKADLRDPLAFVVVENWWAGNYGGVRGFYGYVEGYYEKEYGIAVDLLTVDGGTDFANLGNANAGKYHTAILLLGHGEIVGPDYILEGEINGWDLLDFLDKIMVKGAGRKGISASMCFAGHPWVKNIAVTQLNTVIKGGDLVAPYYSSTIEKREIGVSRYVPSGVGIRILEAINEFYGLGRLASYVEYDGQDYWIGPEVD